MVSFLLSPAGSATKTLITESLVALSFHNTVELDCRNIQKMSIVYENTSCSLTVEEHNLLLLIFCTIASHLPVFSGNEVVWCLFLWFFLVITHNSNVLL